MSQDDVLLRECSGCDVVLAFPLLQVPHVTWWRLSGLSFEVAFQVLNINSIRHCIIKAP
jgi:hypothetical protein